MEAMVGEWTEADLAHGEGLLHAAALTAEHGALEGLHSLPGALDHPDIHLDGVAGAELGDVVAQAVAVDDFSRVHERGPNVYTGSVPDGTS
jgi:hypothetical protein